MAMAPHNVYRCEGFDKWVAIAVSTEEEWLALCNVVGHPEWADDPRFSDSLSRWHNQGELDKLITEWTLQRTDYDAMHAFRRPGWPLGPFWTEAGFRTIRISRSGAALCPWASWRNRPSPRLPTRGV